MNKMQGGGSFGSTKNRIEFISSFGSFRDNNYLLIWNVCVGVLVKICHAPSAIMK